MALVDHERVLLAVKALALSKPHIGQRELLECIAEAEVSALVDVDHVRMMFQRFSVELEEAFLNVIPAGGADQGPATDTARAAEPALGDAEGDHPSNGHTATEDSHARRNDSDAGRARGGARRERRAARQPADAAVPA